VHATHSRFFQALEDPTLIYVLGLWPNLQTHQSFLASPLKPEILSPQQDLLDFGWMIHIPLEDLESLPLGAPIVAIARLHVKGGEHVIAHKEITGRYGGMLVERTKPYGVVEGWRVDGEEGAQEQEQVVITGWEAKEDHLAFGAGLRETYPDYAGLRDHWQGIEVNHMRDMEK